MATRRKAREMSMKGKKIKVLLAKLNFDAHDRGIRYVARSLRDRGMEVVLIRFGLPEEVVSAYIQEDADVLGISILTGGHLTVLSDVMNLIRQRNQEKPFVIVGGIIPPDDVPKLQELGVGKVFPPGSSTDGIAEYIQSSVQSD
jgi:methylmalonyl-CoA mutase C-terminal domain/subunit